MAWFDVEPRVCFFYKERDWGMERKEEDLMREIPQGPKLIIIIQLFLMPSAKIKICNQQKDVLQE